MHIQIHEVPSLTNKYYISVSHKKTKILFSKSIPVSGEFHRSVPAGCDLPDLSSEYIGNINDYSGIFISNGLSNVTYMTEYFREPLPFFIGKPTYRIANSLFTLMMPTKYLEHKSTIEIGTLAITPYLAEYAYFDSYLFLVSDGLTTALIVDSLPENKFKPFARTLHQLPKSIDFFCCPKRSVNSRQTLFTELEIYNQMKNLCRRYRNYSLFILLNPMNIDRIFTVSRIAGLFKRIMLEPESLFQIIEFYKEKIPSPFLYKHVKLYNRQLKQSFLQKKYPSFYPDIKELSSQSFIMLLDIDSYDYLNYLNEHMPLSEGLLINTLNSDDPLESAAGSLFETAAHLEMHQYSLFSNPNMHDDTINRLLRRLEPKTIIE